MHAYSLSCVQLFQTLWTVAHQVPLSIVFPKQEYWSGLPFPLPRDLPNPGNEPLSLMSPTLAGRLYLITVLNYLVFIQSHIWTMRVPSDWLLCPNMPPIFVFFFFALSIFWHNKMVQDPLESPFFQLWNPLFQSLFPLMEMVRDQDLSTKCALS